MNPNSNYPGYSKNQSKILPRQKSRKQVTFFVAWIFVTAMIFVAIGCNRQFYRQQADCEVYQLIHAAPKDKRWELNDYTIQANPKSRFYDPYNPDCEPMPPDDPRAHQFMHSVAGMETAEWDTLGRTPHVENSEWRRYLMINENGEMTLNHRQAFQLAQLHSPEFQTALENLYLSALDVSFQRFQFDTRFEHLSSLFYNTRGADGSSNWSVNNGLDMTKMSATGGEYMIGIANSLTWTLSGPKDTGPGTVLSMSILQPLLRGGGRAVVLEELTRSERNLLSNIRQMAFYRQGFYNRVVAGGQNVGMPTAAGAPSGNSSGVTGVGGYIALLLQQIRINNQRADVVAQRRSQEQLLENFRAGRLDDRLQVEQAKNGYLGSISSLLELESRYNTSVEQFLVGLVGLPPDLKTKVHDPLLDQFELMSPKLEAFQEQIGLFLKEIRDDQQEIPPQAVETLIQISSQVNAEIPNIRQDIDHLDHSVSERIANLKFLQERLTKLGRSGELESYNAEELVKRVERVHYWMPFCEKNLKTIDKLIQQIKTQNPDEIEEMLRQGTIDPLSLSLMKQLEIHTLLDETKKNENEEDESSMGREVQLEHQAQKVPYRTYLIRVANRLLQEIRFLSVNQARARLDSITMIPIDITPETSLKIAAENRLDWMNERTALVNSWRNIKVVANRLQGYLNLKFNGEIGTPHDKPLDFQSSRSSLSVGMEFKAPLTRLAERNEYRVSLIEYQRARRDYYRYVDTVNVGLREKLRRIETIQLDFELQRELVNVAISQVMLAQMNMEKPQEIGFNTKMSENLARNLTDALRSLLNAQNSLTELWTEYYALRISLCLDLGLMQLDEQGMWIDPGSIREIDYIRFVRNGSSQNMNIPQENNNVFPEELVSPPAVGVIEEEQGTSSENSKNGEIDKGKTDRIPPPPLRSVPKTSTTAVPDFKSKLPNPKVDNQKKTTTPEKVEKIQSSPKEGNTILDDELPPPLSQRRIRNRLTQSLSSPDDEQAAPLPQTRPVSTPSVPLSNKNEVTQTTFALSPSGKTASMQESTEPNQFLPEPRIGTRIGIGTELTTVNNHENDDWVAISSN